MASNANQADELDVLIVDDEVDIALDLAEWLTRKGLSVQTANDGQAALRVLGHVSPRFVITDLRMPGMSGFDLVAEIRAQKGGEAPAFIVLSGHGAVFDADRAAALDAFAVLEKPVNLRNLLAMLTN
ncbi:MAG: response regulator [Alphaproteobacteria bacterium]